MALEHPDTDPEKVVQTCGVCMDNGGNRVNQSQFEENLSAKLEDGNFAVDISPLLASDKSWDPDGMAEAIMT